MSDSRDVSAVRRNGFARGRFHRMTCAHEQNGAGPRSGIVRGRGDGAADAVRRGAHPARQFRADTRLVRRRVVPRVLSREPAPRVLADLEALPWNRPECVQVMLHDEDDDCFGPWMFQDGVLVEVSIPRTRRVHVPPPSWGKDSPDPGCLWRTDGRAGRRGAARSLLGARAGPATFVVASTGGAL